MSELTTTTTHYHFVTGRLAADALRAVVDEIAKKLGFSYSIGVMPITVAALITPRWLIKHLQIPSETTEVILPGYCDVGLDTLREQCKVKLTLGPRDLRDLPQFFGEKNFFAAGYGKYSIEILAEINHAPRMDWNQLLLQAKMFADEGADIIDLGCDPAAKWLRVADAVKAIRDLGLRVSIDTFDRDEAAAASRAGAEMVLSVNRSNRDAAKDWGASVVAIPDSPQDLPSLFDTIEFLERDRVSTIADPILEPIGVGLMSSLSRYAEVRARFPQLPILMGVGNLSELTDVDSAGTNLLLLSICEELSVRYVLTTQVINWARSSIRECAVARKLAHFARKHRVPPKHIDSSLIRLRDPKLKEFPVQMFEQLAAGIRDNNFRIFAQGGQIHVISANLHLSHHDPFELFDALQKIATVKNLDASHSFYLGFEMSKALTALTLGKNYEQDEALQWGDLTRPEKHHRLQRRPPTSS